MRAASYVFIGRYPISICLAIALHFVWAVGVLVDPSSIDTTATHTIGLAMPVWAASLTFAAVAVAALVGLMIDDINWAPLNALTETWRLRLRFALLMPQQAVLWFSLVGATHAMYLGTFADGVVRTQAFLIVDQIPVVLIALGHLVAMSLIAQDGLHSEREH